MNYTYFKSSSDKEELFGIYNNENNKFFILNLKSKGTMVIPNSNIIQSRMKEIEMYEYIFDKNTCNSIIAKINMYIQCSNMTYRKKTLNKLLNDIEYLKKIIEEKI